MELEYDVTRVQQALQFLVDSPYGVRHINRIKAVVAKPRACPFRADAEPLNELLVIGRQSPEALIKLIDVVEYKRRSRGSYQRDFMATKRARERKVIELEARLQGKNLTLDERNLVLQKQYQVWGIEKRDYIDSHAPETWLERNEVIREFWAEADAQLDRKLAHARNQEERVVRRKTVFHRAWGQPTSVLGEKLAGALQSRVHRPLDSHP